MSEENQNDNTQLKILSSLFTCEEEKITSIINNPQSLESIIPFLQDETQTTDSKFELLSQLIKLFKENKILMPYFVRNCKKNNISFLEILMSLYLNEKTNSENIILLNDLFDLLLSNVSISKTHMEFLYQKLSQYYNSLDNNNNNNLNENLLLRFLNLLQIFYDDYSKGNENENQNKNINHNKSINNNNKSIEPKIKNRKISADIIKDFLLQDIKDYIYFNGKGSFMTISLNKSSINVNTNFPTLENGCSILFWLYIDKEVINKYFNLYKNININIAAVNIGGYQLKLLFKSPKSFQFLIDGFDYKIESNEIDVSAKFHYNQWNNICFLVGQKMKGKPVLTININGFDFSLNSFLTIPKEFPINESINTIKLFENLIGRVSSVVFFSFIINLKVLTDFRNFFKQGIYKNKYMFKFLVLNDKDYFLNCPGYKYCQKYKNADTNSFKLNIKLKDQNIKNLMAFFCPFTYDKKENIIDDVFGNFIGVLGNEDGVNNFYIYGNSLNYLGGVNNLLPIIEMMYINQNLLTEETFLQFLKILQKILIDHPKNLCEANNNKFFSSLGLFLEKYPPKIFTENILEILLKIGKEAFQITDEKYISSHDNFVNMILLNEKIFSKFSPSNQSKLWESVYQFFTSDYSQMRDCLNIFKICLLLRFYDENRYNEYCCKRHASLFNDNGNNNDNNSDNNNNKGMKVMEPEMNMKVDKLFDTIQLYIDKLYKDKDTVNLFKLLSLDLSPCLQKKIIQVYIKHFSNTKIASKEKAITIENLLKNNFFEISEYVLSISLLDVRIELLQLFKIILKNHFSPIKNFFFVNKNNNLNKNTNNSNNATNTITTNNNNITNNNINNTNYSDSDLTLNDIYSFMSDNLLPERLMVEIDNNNQNVNTNNINIKNSINMCYGIKETYPLINYLNKEFYEEDICLLWKLLSEWFAYQETIIVGGTKAKYHMKLNSFVLDFCIKFVSSKVPILYINTFTLSIINYLQDTTITNKEVIYENKNLFYWLIETIFYFHNKENLAQIEQKDWGENIQRHSLEIYIKLFSYKKINDDFYTKINYIFEYSYNLKKFYISNERQLFEIERITRLLLEKILDIPVIVDMNSKAKVYFDFMLLYKKNNDDFELQDIESYNINQIPSSKRKKTNLQGFNDSTASRNKTKGKKLLSASVGVDNSNAINIINQPLPLINKSSDSDDIIPSYIYEGLFINEINPNQSERASMTSASSSSTSSTKKENEKEPKAGNLKVIWKDFLLYDNIIDSFHSTLWGIENICKKVRIDYDQNPLSLCKKLIKEYSETKKYKNILLKDILNSLNIKPSSDSDLSKGGSSFNPNITNVPNNPLKKSITTSINYLNNNNNNYIHSSSIDISKDYSFQLNSLNINLILLCVAIDITKDNDEREFLEGYYQQFLIFCVLGSINIAQSEKSNSFIQKKLTEILSFGWVFFQKRNKTKYQKTLDSLIKPIFEEIYTEQAKKGIKGLFSKKNIFKNTAVFNVFDYVDENETKKKKEKEMGKTKDEYNSNNPNFDFEDNNVDLNSTVIVGYSTDRRGFFKKGISSKDSNIYKDDTSISKNKKKKMIVVIKKEIKKKIGELFNNILLEYKKERNKGVIEKIIKNFYKHIFSTDDNVNNNNNFYNIDQKGADERNRVNNNIKDLIPIFGNQIKKYSNTSFLQERKRKNDYKACKKELFSWRGFWSNRFLFYEHPEYLKLKKKNHFTKEMLQPLLTPILDMEYYLPEFKKFNKNKLFNKNNFNYRINLDIDEILQEKTEKRNIDNNLDMDDENNDNKNEEEDSSSSKNFVRNNFGFNYLECIYKLPYNGLWEQYMFYHKKNFNLEKKKKEESEDIIILDNILNNSMLVASPNENKEVKNDKKISIENTYNCCMVKLTRHIKGFLSTEKESFKFISEMNSGGGNNNNEIDDPNYDKDMGRCFGSIFKNLKKDKDIIDFEIFYPNIKYMFLRHYFYNETGIEIFTETNKSYFFNFKTNKDLFKFIYDVLHHSSFKDVKTEDYKGKKLLGYEKIGPNGKKKSYSISHKMEEWQNYNISTLEYLMWLNIYAGRSFNDLTQYPVFPWIITNYQSEELNPKNDYRNLSVPMGMMENDDKAEMRKEAFLERYDSMKNDLLEMFPDFNYQDFLKKGDEYFDNYIYKKQKREKSLSVSLIDDNNNIVLGTQEKNIVSPIQVNQIPYFFGSHYSNPTYITNFLSRTFPYSLIAIEIQGDKFDDPDRMFLSMQKTFISASSLKDDIRELIPEFYSIPEVFKNINNLDLSQGHVDSEGKQIIINDVDLPLWSKNSPYFFVGEMRKNLENHDLKINKWIDLIFGYYQRGEKAEENHNIYMAQTYERMVKIDNIDDSDSRNALMRLIEMGVTPFQLFDNESKGQFDRNQLFAKNNIYSMSKKNFLDESKKLCTDSINTSKYSLITHNKYQNSKNTSNKDYTIEIFPKVEKIIWMGQNNLKIITNTNNWYNLKYTQIDNKTTVDESNINEVENNSSKYAASYLLSGIHTPLILYNNNKYLLKGGFWDGRIEINSISTAPKEEPISTCIFPSCGPIVAMAMSQDENFLVCGTKIGYLIVYKVMEQNLEIKQKIYDHSDEITSIGISDTLNMYASSAKDGYINLYTMPTNYLVRSIKFNFDETMNQQIYANNIFLASSPLPCFAFFISQKKIFVSYTINGGKINEIKEVDYSCLICCSIVFSNINFQDFLIYGTDDGFVKIRKFPEMSLINSINLIYGEPIRTISLSPDKRFCYIWGREDKIIVIKDDFEEQISTENIARMGFNIK